MLTPEQENYLSIIANTTSEGLDIFELAYSVLDFRDVRSITTGRNVASTLLHYSGTHFPPTPAVSEFQAGGRRDQHGERLSFTHIIRRAIESQWGPFRGITLSPNDIPTALTIEYLEQHPVILAALQQLDYMRIFSERAFCFYRNDTVDRGCLPYFTQIDQMMGSNKVILLQTMGIQLEEVNQRELDRILPILKANERTIDRKAQILRAKAETNRNLQVSYKEFRQSIAEALAAKREEYLAIPIENVEQRQVVMKQVRDIQKPPPTHALNQLRENLNSLRRAETEVNEELWIAFGLQTAPDMQRSATIAPPPPPPDTGGSKRQHTPGPPPAPHESNTSGGASPAFMSGGGSIFGETTLSNRKGLKSIKLDEIFPNIYDFSLGEAVDDGGCFFDSIAQALNLQFKTSQYTEKSLRQKCHAYYMKNREEVDAWNNQDYRGIDQGEKYLMVQYTNSEMNQHFHGQPPIWGRPNIEGKILCRALNLEAILVLEILEDPATKAKVPSFRKVTSNDDKTIDNDEADRLIQEQRYPVLVCDQKALHFVPLLSKASLEDSSRLKPTREKQLAQLSALQGTLEQGRNTGQGLAADTVSHTTMLPGFGTTTHIASSLARSAENDSSKNKLTPAKRKKREDDEERDSPKPP